CPLYIKSHSEGEFVFDWSWADAAERAGIRYYPKLLVGVPFTPVSGARFLVASGLDRSEWVARLGQALRELCLANEFSSVHVCFAREDEIAPLRSAGFELRIGVQYHWRNDGYPDFEAYLERFRSKRRNQIRRERRALEQQGIRIEAVAGDAISDELFDSMYRFYQLNVRGKSWGRQYLNRRFFELLKERFRMRLCFVIARREGHPIAGTLNVRKGDSLYGRYWGCDSDLRYLHFNVCYYAAIEHCIEQRIQRFEPGAGGDYKQLRGFDAQPTWSLHFVADPRLRAAVSRFLKLECKEAESTIDWLRERSALKPAALTLAGDQKPR
ncbi:MAG: GNAT family N-acetyltransferase, partial [Deltaproteobacteria bacterium]|nr:GNAT family N-acetyltransferase [Deltaproteobacteria bacterium]